MKTILKTIILFLLFSTTLWSCKKEESPLDIKPVMKLIANYPIANVGVQIKYTVADPETGTTGFRWDFGDGSPLVNNDEIFAYHSYSNAGTYTVKVDVFNSGAIKTLTTTVKIED